jgi:hypothetical protein
MVSAPQSRRSAKEYSGFEKQWIAGEWKGEGKDGLPTAIRIPAFAAMERNYLRFAGYDELLPVSLLINVQPAATRVWRRCSRAYSRTRSSCGCSSSSTSASCALVKPPA